jgi:hypothetical protein
VSPEILDRAKSLEGWHVRLTFPAFVEGQTLRSEGKILGAPEAHGYTTPGGGWALYGSETLGYVTSWRVRFRYDHKRKDVFLRLDDCLSIEVL